MPVEIKELIIRASILTNPSEGSKANASIGTEVKEEIIAACAEQVLRILERKRER